MSDKKQNYIFKAVAAVFILLPLFVPYLAVTTGRGVDDFVTIYYMPIRFLVADGLFIYPLVYVLLAVAGTLCIMLIKNPTLGFVLGLVPYILAAGVMCGSYVVVTPEPIAITLSVMVALLVAVAIALTVLNYVTDIKISRKAQV